MTIFFIFLNIGPDAKLKPVTVYIHGGMFAWGSGNLVDGTVMSAYADSVVVSLNYRLNILGVLDVLAFPDFLDNSEQFLADHFSCL